MMKLRCIAAVLLGVVLSAPPLLAAEAARDMYADALAQERQVRDAGSEATVVQMRRIVASYEEIVRRYPTSGYSDNALWQGGNLAMLIYERFGDERDRTRARRLFEALTSQYPSSTLKPRAQAAIHDLETATPATTLATPAPAAVPPPAPVDKPEPAPTTGSTPAAMPAAPLASSTPGVATLKEIHRTLLPDGVRVTIDLDSEVAYHQEEVDRPARVFFDLKGVKAAPALQDVSLKFDDDVVREIRLGRHPQNTTRVVMDLQGVAAYSVYPMYSPYRLVIDFKRAAATRVTAAPPPAIVASLPATPPATESMPAPSTPVAAREAKPDPKPQSDSGKASLPSKQASPIAAAPPAANLDGKFSISRQLGLGVSRVVIDAGHGGHDPGAQANGVTEAELTLDVALRLQKLLQKQEGVEVVMTRDTDVFIPLQERTAIANREGADLFLSIHANASRNSVAHGVETYFLNFANNPEAEAVAARENAGSGQSMHSLPDIVKAIALNNKINESRDFADTVQKSMVKHLRTRNKTLRDLGVKQAPFVVLIGAGMPSVLAEVSFVTNKQEGTLLKGGPYRQQIAQALFDAVVNYQQALRKMSIVAAKKATDQ